MWITTKQSLPDDDMAVLVWDGDVATEAHMDTNRGGFVEHQTGNLIEASHWMHMPPGPTSEFTGQAVIMVPFDVFQSLPVQIPVKEFDVQGVHVEHRHRLPDHAPSILVNGNWYVAKPRAIATAIIEALRDCKGEVLDHG